MRQEGSEVSAGRAYPLSQALCLPPFEKCAIQALAQETPCALGCGQSQFRLLWTLHPDRLGRDSSPLAQVPVQWMPWASAPFDQSQKICPSASQRYVITAAALQTRGFSDFFSEVKNSNTVTLAEPAERRERAFPRCTALSRVYGTFAFK